MLEYILNGYEYNIVHYMFRMSTLKKNSSQLECRKTYLGPMDPMIQKMIITLMIRDTW